MIWAGLYRKSNAKYSTVFILPTHYGYLGLFGGDGEGGGNEELRIRLVFLQLVTFMQCVGQMELQKKGMAGHGRVRETFGVIVCFACLYDISS